MGDKRTVRRRVKSLACAEHGLPLPPCGSLFSSRYAHFLCKFVLLLDLRVKSSQQRTYGRDFEDRIRCEKETDLKLAKVQDLSRTESLGEHGINVRCRLRGRQLSHASGDNSNGGGGQRTGRGSQRGVTSCQPSAISCQPSVVSQIVNPQLPPKSNCGSSSSICYSVLFARADRRTNQVRLPLSPQPCLPASRPAHAGAPLGSPGTSSAGPRSAKA